MLFDLLDITSRRAMVALNDLKLHWGPWFDRAIALPRKSGKVKEDLFA